ncbi:DUF3106 domain-containing protein [Ramlibacter sp. USB13]|uniref:DUF3106 domain-containing protein n=1 Tax=Ramlibacter cellulosilyticus TaxID=2764187 RepID=A0A923SBQ0_9BURK|nr:DUF3106 domain-containing protein [Ramlibacter cellulosilyticus]MBC5783403.1 DUF3106 domain-containing protein [Ramlibacter cellulosilyticus]
MTPPLRPALPTLLLLAAGFVLAAASAAVAQAQPAAPASAVVGQASKPSVSTKEPIRPAAVRNAPPTRAEAQPTWAELTGHQQQALAPLAATWRTLGEAHKRKWLVLSENFHSMPPPEQARLHSRMTEWAALSPQQRTAARLNFAEVEKVAPDDKRAKWEAYQALPPEEKKKLQQRAAAAKPAPPPTAIAVQPVPKEKLAKIPPKGKKPEASPQPAPAAQPAQPAPPAAPAPVEGSALLPTPASPTAP